MDLFYVRCIIHSVYNWSTPLHEHLRTDLRAPETTVDACAEARIAIGSGDRQPFLMSNDGLSRHELAAALEAVNQNRALLLKRSRELHGDA